MNDAAPAGFTAQQATGLPDRVTAAAGVRLVRRLALTIAPLALALAAVQVLAWVRPLTGLLQEVARTHGTAAPLAALLTALAGIAGTWLLASARRRGDAARVARMARWPQVLLMGPLAVLVALAALLTRFAPGQDAGP